MTNGNGNGGVMSGAGPGFGGTMDFSGFIPTFYARQIIEEATQQSAILSLPVTTMPMGTKTTELIVPAQYPKAYWVSADNPRKPFTDMKLTARVITAEEVAAVVAIPDNMIADLDINIWAWVRPKLAEAIAAALDAAVLFGEDAPASFPAGGLLNPDYTTIVGAGTDVVDTVNLAMAAVENQGLTVSGSAADLTVKSRLRGVRDESGALLLGADQVGTNQVQTLYGAPIRYQAFDDISTADFITGAWSNVVIGIRQDIRYEMNPAAVLADDEGRVVLSGFQDNATPMKVWARYAFTVMNPVSRRFPQGAKPFGAALMGAGIGGTSGAVTHADYRIGSSAAAIDVVGLAAERRAAKGLGAGEVSGRELHVNQRIGPRSSPRLRSGGATLGGDPVQERRPDAPPGRRVRLPNPPLRGQMA